MFLCWQLIKFILLIHIWWILVYYKHLRTRYSYSLYSSLSSPQFQALLKEWVWPITCSVGGLSWQQITVVRTSSQHWNTQGDSKSWHSWCLELMNIVSRSQCEWNSEKAITTVFVKTWKMHTGWYLYYCSSCWIIVVFIPVLVCNSPAVTAESLQLMNRVKLLQYTEVQGENVVLLLTAGTQLSTRLH